VVRGGITKTGNREARRMLIEAAWSYRYPARVAKEKVEIITRLPKVVRDIAWKAQVRLCARYRRLSASAKKPTVVVAAIARELAGFVWVIGQAIGRLRRNPPLPGCPAGAGRKVRAILERPLGPASPTPVLRPRYTRDDTWSCGSQPADGRLINRRQRRSRSRPDSGADRPNAAPSARRAELRDLPLEKGHGRGAAPRRAASGFRPAS
jgi:hypothetical protein